jgi:hypothetical protein
MVQIAGCPRGLVFSSGCGVAGVLKDLDSVSLSSRKDHLTRFFGAMADPLAHKLHPALVVRPLSNDSPPAFVGPCGVPLTMVPWPLAICLGWSGYLHKEVTE